MKILMYISLVLVVAFSVSCTKNEVEYNTTPIGEMAEFQLHYFVPVTAVAANNINKVLINGQLYSNRKAPLSTYNAIPSGSVGRFFMVEPGTVNIKLYTGATDTTLVRVYNKNVTLTKGKQNVFVHDTAQSASVFDNGFPYTTNVTMDTDSTCWVKFYNLLYETAGVPNVPTALRLQYQMIDPRNAANLINIGPPVSFGETTGWQVVKVIKDTYNSTGSRRVDYRIKVVDAGGVVLGDLQIRNSSGVYVSYADYWTAFIGRRYHHTLSGFRAATPGAAVRVFTAL
jgi:hypothetical protein